MVRPLNLCAYLAVVIGCTGMPDVGQPRANNLYAPHPSHYHQHNNGGSADRSAITRKTKQARAGSRVIVRDEGRLIENWVLSADLSKACNKRRFRQKRDNFLIAVVDGRTYGAAIGGHGSLLDRAKLAEKQVVYLFRGQGTTDCRVYHRTK